MRLSADDGRRPLPYYMMPPDRCRAVAFPRAAADAVITASTPLPPAAITAWRECTSGIETMMHVTWAAILENATPRHRSLAVSASASPAPMLFLALRFDCNITRHFSGPMGLRKLVMITYTQHLMPDLSAPDDDRRGGYGQRAYAPRMLPLSP